MPVGVASVRDGRLVDAGDFGELIIGLGRFTMQAESVTVTHDGRDGMPAVVRAIGPLRAIPLLNEFGYAIAPADYGDIRVAVATGAVSAAALPVRVQVIPVGAPSPSLPASYGEPVPGFGRLHVAFPTDGCVTLPAPPGSYRVVVSRGPFYDLSDTTVTVTAGMTVRVPVTLRRVVATPGVLCGDFHIHTVCSPDSEDDARLKVASGAADNLEVMARSHHEWVGDFQPLIDSMGLARHVRGVVSIELTTFTYGHFGVFSLNADTSQINNGNFAWANRLPPAVFADVRARPEHPTLVINHPRGARNGAYFEAAGYNPAEGTANPTMWDDGFTAVEFFNDSSFEENPAQVRDWFSFLARG